MKKLAVIHNGKTDRYEVHHYDILFKITPYGNPFTFICSGDNVDSAKQRAYKSIKGEKTLIEIYEIK